MEYVDAFVPLYLPGQPFAAQYAEVRIRPVHDETFKWDIAADVEYWGLDEKWHPVIGGKADAILEDIRKNDPDKWRMIEAAANSN